MAQMTHNRDNELAIIPSVKIEDKKTLACGSDGCVYKASHTDWGLVAVKTLFEVESVPCKVEKKLIEEARKLFRISHPHIIQMLGVIMEAGNYSIVMEFLPRGCLEDFLQNYEVGWALKVRFVYQIILGMNYLHTQTPPIIHQDLKAQNVLVDNSFGIKIADFGISEWKNTSKRLSRNTSGHQRGTVTHIPPEKFENINHLPDEKVDVYAFSILIWEIQTENAPFSNACTEIIIQAVKGLQRPNKDDIPSDAPKLLQSMMEMCWQQDPKQRPSFKELKETIENDPLKRKYDEEAKEEEINLLTLESRTVGVKRNLAEKYKAEIQGQRMFEEKQHNEELPLIDDKLMRSTPVHEAAAAGHLDIVKYLHGAGKSLSAADGYGYSPLQIAIDRERLSVVQYLIEQLIEAGAGVDNVDMFGGTPLSEAVSGGHLSIVKSLVEAGASDNITNKKKSGLVSLAAAKGNLLIVDYLVREAGFSFEDFDEEGNTPIMRAAYNGHLDIVKYLNEAMEDTQEIPNPPEKHKEEEMEIA